MLIEFLNIGQIITLHNYINMSIIYSDDETSVFFGDVYRPIEVFRKTAHSQHFTLVIMLEYSLKYFYNFLFVNTYFFLIIV